MASNVRQNYHAECEKGINDQINMELYASYTYLSMACYFDRDDVALPGFYKYFKKQADDEREHADKLLRFQNMRGGKVLLKDIKKPEKDEWGTGLDAMKAAVKLERLTNQSLIALHKVAEDNSDAQMADFIEEEYLNEQVRSISEIGHFVTQLERVGPGMGEYMFDKETLQELMNSS